MELSPGEECGHLEPGELLHDDLQLVVAEAAVFSEVLDDPDVMQGLFIFDQLGLTVCQILEGFSDLTKHNSDYFFH